MRCSWLKKWRIRSIWPCSYDYRKRGSTYIHTYKWTAVVQFIFWKLHEIEFCRCHPRVSGLFSAVLVLPAAAGWHRSGDWAERTRWMWFFFWLLRALWCNICSAALSRISYRCRMFVRTVLPSRSGALTPNLQKHRAPSAPWASKSEEEHVANLFHTTVDLVRRGTVVFSFWSAFCWSRGLSGSSGKVFSLVAFPGRRFRSVVNYVNLLASGGPWITLSEGMMIPGKRRGFFVKVFHWRLDKQNLVPCRRRIRCLILFWFSMHAICIRFSQINYWAFTICFFGLLDLFFLDFLHDKV